MNLYLEIIKFRFLRFLAYPYEIFASIFKRLIGLFSLLFIWILVNENLSDKKPIEEIISYFLIAQGVEELVTAKWGGLGQMLGHLVKQGTLSNYLIKPVSIIPFLNASAIGKNGINLTTAILSLVAGIIIYPEKSLVGFLLFIPFLMCAYAVAFSYNLFLGTLGFHMTEASGFKNSIEHMVRMLSGAWIPLMYFPENYLQLVKILPFQAMVYGPTNALFTKVIDIEVIGSLLIAISWSILLNIGVLAFWRRSIRNYEAIGI